jgi:4-amino-4-deoxy-L-arabinose transferase-like glycosyltransferase
MPDKVKTARLCLIVAGWLKIATAGLFLFIFVAGFLVVGRGERYGLLGSALLGATGLLLFAVSAAAGAVDIIAAGGVRRRAKWARYLGIFLGVLLLPLFPFCTVLGLFVLSGLLGEEARAWFTESPESF